MSFWDRLLGRSPDARQPARMIPATEFRQLVEKSANSVLAPQGWRQHEGVLQWDRECRSWATVFLEFPPLKGGGVTIRWGLRLSFVPPLGGRPARFGDRIKERSVPDFTYEPADYEKHAGQWALSRFSTENEISESSKALAEHANKAASELCELCVDAESLARCFEEKRSRKHVRFGFYDYPQEIFAYSIVLGLCDRKAEGSGELEKALEIAAIPSTKAEKLRAQVMQIWESVKLTS